MASRRNHTKVSDSLYHALEARRERIQRHPIQDVGISKKRKRKAKRRKALSDGFAQLQRSLSGSSKLATAAPSSYHFVSNEHRARVIALDCEMVGVSEGTSIKSALGRCSIVNYNEEVLFDRYVLPVREIVDYRTAWSGITRYNMRSALPFSEALSRIRQIVKDKVLVGHDLKHDFAVLEFVHPQSQTRDTSTYMPLRSLAKLATEHPPSLRNLVRNLLGEHIQQGMHCSVQDACAVLKVYKYVEEQWEYDMNQQQQRWTKPGSSSQFVIPDTLSGDILPSSGWTCRRRV